MKLKHCVLASLLMFSASAVLADVALPYGEGSGKVDFINNVKYPKIDDPLPLGPLAFRCIGDSIWVADSVGGKLIQLDGKGRVLSEFSVLPKGKKPYIIDKYKLPILNFLIEDFAPVYDKRGRLDSLWVAVGMEEKLIQFSPKGDRLMEISNPDFRQFYRVEIGKGGHIFVSDKGARAIFTFDSDGNFLNKQNWEWSGMAVSGSDDLLYRLMFDNEANKNILVATNLEGKVVSTVPVDVEGMFNPKLWWVDESKGECLITSTPREGFKGTYELRRVALDGKVKALGELSASPLMNRFIDKSVAGGVCVGKCDYYTAPNGKFEVVPLKMP